MFEDPIIEELRKLRDEYAQRFDYDLDAICRDIQDRQSRLAGTLVSFPAKPVSGATVNGFDKESTPCGEAVKRQS